MKIRTGTPDDIPGIVSFLQAHPEGPLPWRNLSVEQRLAYRVHHWEHLLDPTTLLAYDEEQLVGVVGLLTDLTDSITAEPQGRVFDSASTRPDVYKALMQEAAEHVRMRNGLYLITFVDAGDTVREQALLELGYRIESHRIAKLVNPPLTENGRKAQTLYRTRGADQGDVMFMAWLCTLNSEWSIPAGRKVDPMEVKSRFMEAHLATEVQEGIFILIAERDGDGVGYLEVKLAIDESVSPDVIGYIQDFTVHPDHWSMASHLLQYETEVQLQAQGVHVLVGDISASNPRSLAASTRKAGFGIESQRWGRQV